MGIYMGITGDGYACGVGYISMQGLHGYEGGDGHVMWCRESKGKHEW